MPKKKKQIKNFLEINEKDLKHNKKYPYLTHLMGVSAIFLICVKSTGDNTFNNEKSNQITCERTISNQDYIRFDEFVKQAREGVKFQFYDIDYNNNIINQMADLESQYYNTPNKSEKINIINELSNLLHKPLMNKEYTLMKCSLSDIINIMIDRDKEINLEILSCNKDYIIRIGPSKSELFYKTLEEAINDDSSIRKLQAKKIINEEFSLEANTYLNWILNQKSKGLKEEFMTVSKNLLKRSVGTTRIPTGWRIQDKEYKIFAYAHNHLSGLPPQDKDLEDNNNAPCIINGELLSWTVPNIVISLGNPKNDTTLHLYCNGKTLRSEIVNLSEEARIALARYKSTAIYPKPEFEIRLRQNKYLINLKSKFDVLNLHFFSGNEHLESIIPRSQEYSSELNLRSIPTTVYAIYPNGVIGKYRITQ